jgi:hypothetical protein
MATATARRIEIAKRAFEKEGESCVWGREIAMVNDAKPWKPGEGIPLTWEGVFVLWLPASTDAERFKQTYENGQTISVKRGMIAGVDFEPQIGDTVTTVDGPWTVTDIDKVAMDGTSILYEIGFAQ